MEIYGYGTVFTPIAVAEANNSYATYTKDANGNFLHWYTTLDDAINQVSDGETIVLLSNQTQSVGDKSGITYTIDGQNRAHTLQLETKNKDGFLINNGNIIYKSVKFNIANKKNFILESEKTGDLVFDNCHIVAQNGIMHRGYGNITLTNGTLYEGENMTSTMFYLRGDHSDMDADQGIITVEDSTIIQQYGGDEPQNLVIFHTHPQGGGNYVFHLKGNTVLKQESNKQDATYPGAGIFFFQIHSSNDYSGNATIYADPTVKLIIASKTTILPEEKVNFIHTDYSTTDKDTTPQKNILRGIPQFIVSEEIAKNGFILPNMTAITSADGKLTYSNKWSLGGSTLYDGNTTVTGTEELMISPVVESASYNNKAAIILSGDGSAPVGYDSLDAAINAVKDGQTIVLLKDATQSVADKEGITYTIDGSGRAYTITPNAYQSENDQCLHIKNGNIIYKGVKFNIASGNNFLFDANKTGDVVFDNCHIVAEGAMTHRGKGNVSFINHTLYEGSSMRSTMFYMRGDNVTGENEAVITVEDSTIIQQAGGVVSQTQNAGIFHCNPRGGATYTFNIKGNAVLKQESAKTNMQGACIFYFQLSDYNGYAGNTVINADSTAKLILASKSTALTEATFIRTDYTIGNNGRVQENVLNGTPQFIASVNVVKQGVTMPNIIHNSADGKIRYTNVWSDGATTFKGNSDATTAYVYKNVNATADVTFTPVNKGYTASSASAIKIGIEKANKVEYYDSWADIEYRRNVNDWLALGADTTISSDIFTQIGGSKPTWKIKGLNRKTKPTLTVAEIPDYHSLSAGHVTFENMNVVLNDSIDTDPEVNGGSITFNDCDITISAAIRVVNNAEVTFNNCNITSELADCLFFIRNSQINTEAVITVNNTDITKGGTDVNTNHANIFHVVHYPATSTTAEMPGYNARLVIKGDSRIENRGTGIKNLHIIHYESAKQTDNRCVLDIKGDDVVFALNPQGASLTDGMFIKVSNNRTIDITKMPKFELNSLAQTSDVKIVGGSSGKYNLMDSGELLGIEVTTNTGEKYLYKDSIPAGLGCESLTAEYLYMDEENGFDMLDGASIRKKDGSGIRFTAQISNWLYNLRDVHNIEFGAILASEKLRDGAEINMDLVETNAAVYVKTKIFVEKNPEYEVSDMLVHTALINIPDNAVAYERRIAGRYVMKVTYDDSSVGYFYSDFGNNNIRSMYDVAKRLEEKNGVSSEAVVDHILGVVKDPTTTRLDDEVYVPEKSIDIYIIAGQSNAAGYTNIDTGVLSGLWSSYSTGTSSVKYIGMAEKSINNYTDTLANEAVHWTNAKAGQGASASQMGAEVGMASYLSENYYNNGKEAGIIKFAHGDTSLLANLGGENKAGGNWMSPSYAEYKGVEYTDANTRHYHKGNGGLYVGLLDQIEYSVMMLRLDGYDDINIKGVFWMQGESDKSNPNEYKIAFKYFVSDLRRDVGEIMGEDMSDLAIMVGEISETSGSAVASTVNTNNAFIAMQRKLPNEINDVYVIGSGAYRICWLENGNNTYLQDTVHWGTADMFAIGGLVGKCIVDNLAEK